MRADTLPLVLPVLGAQNLGRGERLRVRLGEIDLITLDVAGSLIERLDQQASAELAQDTEDDEDDSASAGPIAIAVDLEASPAEAEASATPSA